ncbi:ABC transporter ATP-binding protein [Pandoraea sp. SD6-2]|uniref:ABC transporter ATP-binding protein n=1 Tax=Pandoraea sp. SD6-2 TaxID=1286093 RepID=UPI00032FCA23|nr:ABC transporter ATP-binding protein [Pandoraea sp. SD6-2]EON13799.1 ABC transporter [Pandoraea sp. SD6-2]
MNTLKNAVPLDRVASPALAEAPEHEHFIDFRNVWLAYDERLTRQRKFAVEGIDLKIARGEFVAIVGPSGCGKSTFMKLATGLRSPSLGEIHIDGRRLDGPLKISGMAFQSPSLLPWRTTLENVLLPLEIVAPYRHDFRKRRDEYAARAQRLLADVGLAGYEDKYPWQLSGGMQQRVSICRALIHEPSLLLLDEPFGALDAFTREELWCILRDLWQKRRFNVILVTHDLRESVFLADTVYVMSASPGRFLLRQQVDLPRPRPIDVTYTSDFAQIVMTLRGHIGHARATSATVDEPPSARHVDAIPSLIGDTRHLPT